MAVLEVKKLYKNYGKQEVLKGLDLTVQKGSVFGFVGQNGAGKTTTMKIILGLLGQTHGEVFICNEKVICGDTRTNRHISYLPDVPEFYPYMNSMEYLTLCGQISRLGKRETKKRSEELLDMVGLEDKKKRIGGYSRGMKQRLGIAQALIHEPEILLCDEPTSALDPVGRKEILEILQAIKGQTTVLFSTHILSDVERICDQVAVLHNGKIALEGKLDIIKKKYKKNSYKIEFESKEVLNQFITGFYHIKDIDFHAEENILQVSILNAEKDAQFLIDRFSEKNILPTRFERLEPDLENLYMEAVQ